MAVKKGLILIKFVSTAGTGTFFIRYKNPKKLQNKLAFMKYDPKVRKHVLFEEKKA